MPKSPVPLEVDGYLIRQFFLRANDAGDDTPAAIDEVAVDFDVYRHPDEALRFVLPMTIASIPKEPNDPYTFHITLDGFFRFKENTPEDTVVKMMVVNAPAILYGIARGYIGQATSTAYNGILILPSVNFVEIANEKAAATQAEQASVAPANETPAP